MSIENSMETAESMAFTRQCDEVDALPSQTAQSSGSCEPNVVGSSSSAATVGAMVAPAATANDGGASVAAGEDGGRRPLDDDGRRSGGLVSRQDSNEQSEANRDGKGHPGVGSNQGNGTGVPMATAATMSNRTGEGRCRRKNRRRKSNRGKSSSNRPYSKTQWKFQCPPGGQPGGGGGRPGGGAENNCNKRRHLYSVAASRRITPFLKSDQPPLVPYNTNRFLMEDHMPQVLTPSGRTRDSSFSIDSEENYFYSLPEDEEDFLTKEFSSVYERERFERLESLSHPDLVQEYIKLAIEYEQLVRRNGVTGEGGVGGGRGGGGGGGGDCEGGNMAKVAGSDGERGDDGSGAARSRLLEERVKVLERENIGK